MGDEDKTVALRIGIVEEENEFLSRLGKVGEEVKISLWREVYQQVNNYFPPFCLYVFLPPRLNVFLSLCLFVICLSASLPLCLSFSLSFCLFASLSLCLSVLPFFCLSFLSFSIYPPLLVFCLFVSRSHVQNIFKKSTTFTF